MGAVPKPSPKRGEPLHLVPLNSSPHEHEYWDTRRNVIRRVRHPHGVTTEVSERPVLDGDRWKLSKIASSIDAVMFSTTGPEVLSDTDRGVGGEPLAIQAIRVAALRLGRCRDARDSHRAGDLIHDLLASYLEALDAADLASFEVKWRKILIEGSAFARGES